MTSRMIGSAIMLSVILFAGAASAQGTPAPLTPRAGWVIRATPHTFPDLVQKLEGAIKDNKMGLVTAASASEGAKAQGLTIPGNRVVGVYRNDFARRMLAASLPAGIEAPIRFYVTENTDGTATLSYRTPTAVFASYFDGAGADLRKVAEELDPIFAKILEDASRP